MKKYTLITLALLIFTAVFAGGPFEKAMSKNIPAMFKASSPEELQSVINQLDRIGSAEGDRWEPYYYSAFGYLRMSGMQEKSVEKDKYLDLALEAVKKGEEIAEGNSELESMRGYVHMIRVTIDPSSRGMKYSGMAFASFQKAVGMNPKNPRAHYLLGRMQYGTAQFMGGGDGGACESFATAKMLFANVDSIENPFAPSWGVEENEQAIAQLCGNGE